MAKIDWSKHNYHREVGFTDNSHEAYKRDIERSRLKFGKHKGKLIQEIPSDYLKWIVQTWEPKRPYFKTLINNARYELAQRQNIASSQTRTKVENPKRSVPDANKH